MSCKKPCKLCPCKPTTPVLHRNLVRQVYDVITKSGGFPCHDKHPTASALHADAIGEDGEFYTTDCVGYTLWGLTREEEINKKMLPKDWASRTPEEKKQLFDSLGGIRSSI